MMKAINFLFPLDHLSPANRMFIALFPTLLFIVIKPFLPDIINYAPLVFFYPAFLFATWLGGSLSGLASLILSSIFVFGVIRPAFVVNASDDVPRFVRIALFYSSTGLVLVLVHFLQKALKASQKSVAVRDEFLNTMSHELRTPITSMKLNLVVLKQEILELTPAKRASLESLERQINKQERLINAIVDLGQIESNDLALRKEYCDLSLLIKKAADAAKDALNDTEVELNLIEVYGQWDRLRMEQAIYNLIHNAIRYGDEKPVKVSLVKTENNVEVKVSNSGSQIIDSHKKSIFTKFERPRHESKVQGPGIGLYLAQHMIELHSGRIDVKTSLNEVTTFTIILPI